MNVSAHKMTGRPFTFRGRLKNHSLNVSVANGGIFRCGAIPPSHFATALSPGVWLKKFAIPGATAASRAHWSIKPML